MFAKVHARSRCWATKMSRRRRSRPISTNRHDTGSASNETADIEIWDDPEWEPALSALQGWVTDVKFPGFKFTGKSDPKPLAKLLRTVPAAVAESLGLWLDPPWGTKGPRLTATLPARYYPGNGSIKSLIGLRNKLRETLPKFDMNVEAAVHQVMSETGVSRSQVMKAHTLSDREIVLRTSKFDRQMYSSPREPEDS